MRLFVNTRFEANTKRTTRDKGFSEINENKSLLHVSIGDK